MPPYVIPQVLVFQEFNRIATEIAEPLRAHISGPHAYLLRYGFPAEKPLGSLGAYDPAAVHAFPWPGRPTGAKVDTGYTKVFVADAELEYLARLAGDGAAIAPVAGTRNQIRWADTSGGFKAGGDAYPRYARLLDRDVRRGDRVRISGLGTDEATYDLETYVLGIASTGADRRAATVQGTPDAAAGNHATQAASAVIAPADDNDNTSVLAVVLTGYSAYADGVLDDVYTIKVVAPETGGDPTTARLTLTSASGKDDTAAVAPAANDTAFAAGGRGLQLKITKDGTTPQPLETGQTWTVTIHDDYVRPTVTAAGTYTGPWDTTYILTCTRGGRFAAGSDQGKPAFTIATTTGVDVSGPITVTATGAAFAVGTRGVTATVAATGTPTGVRKDDKWYIPVTAQADGAFRTLALGHSLPAELLTATDLELHLAIRTDIEVPSPRYRAEPLRNWEQSATAITLNDGMTATEASWTDGGVPQDLPVTTGRVYVEYRAWRDELTHEIGSIDDIAAIDTAITGPLTPDNPLKWGVYKALANANGTAVKFTAVADPDALDSWATMLSLLTGRDDVYNLVPLTFDRAVQDLVAAHVQDQSSPEAGRWRAAFFGIAADELRAIVDPSTSTDGAAVLATFADDPETAGSQYTRVTVPGGNADFLTAGIRPGDSVRGLYTTSWGEESYAEFSIDAVLTEDSLRLVAGPNEAIAVPQRIEVWRRLTNAELAADVARRAGSFGSRRIKAVRPMGRADAVGSGGTRMPHYYLAAALAGLRSGVVPHQGLTNVALAGFDELALGGELGTDALSTMAADGTWVVVQDPDGTVKSRHAVTTDNASLDAREETIVANVDSISHLFLRRLRPYIGVMNVTPTALSRLRIEIVSVIEFLKANGYTETLGGQLIDGAVTQLRAHALLKDRVVAIVTLTVPSPLNALELHQQIVI
jgi:hypothetical protein